MSGRPYLSIVAASRNDDHGGNLLGRTNLFIEGLADHTRRHGLDAELVLVEWNPPADKPTLDKVLDWSSARDAGLTARIVRVPSQLHHRFAHSDALPFFQMIAKNVGVRRAQGEFVLATNVDNLFSDQLMAWLAERPLAPKQVYRLDRYDVPACIPTDLAPRNRLAWCTDNAFRVARRDGLYIRKKGGVNAPFKRAALRNPIMAAAKYYDEMTADTGPLIRRHARASAAVGAKMLRVFARRWKKPLHTNASGDFTLMSKGDWFDLCGYPEFEIHSWHIDGVLLYQAHRRGLSEEVLEPPCCAYHIEHENGWTPENHRKLFDHLQELGIPRLADSELDGIITRLREGPCTAKFNDANWGLAEEKLEEIALN